MELSLQSCKGLKRPVRGKIKPVKESDLFDGVQRERFATTEHSAKQKAAMASKEIMRGGEARSELEVNDFIVHSAKRIVA